jgi:hypothetical protein
LQNRIKEEFMKRVRGMLAHSPAIAISMLALVFALGSGAGYAASTASSSGQPVFHRLKLAPFWTGRAWYTVVDGVVYLSGVVVGHKKGHPEALQLPRSVVPNDLQEIPVSFGGIDGAVSIFPNGEAFVIPPPHFKPGFVSLAGVSYPIGAPF